MQTREDALALDAADPLAPLRAQFALPPGVIYLDGNSLGVLPVATAARVQQVVTEEWGQGLIRSWNDAGWIDLPQRIGDKIARLVGAGPGELAVRWQSTGGQAGGGHHEPAALGAHQRARPLRVLQGRARAAADAPGQPHRRTAPAPLVPCPLKNSGLPAASVKMTWPDAYHPASPSGP